MPELIANLVDIPSRKISKVRMVFGEKIQRIEQIGDEPDPTLPYLMPGFIDAHVHVESSMLIPAEFARLAVVHGTVGTVSDPHEIANVCGLEGIKYMIENGKTVPFKFHFGAPSCVPATTFETAGASLDTNDVAWLLDDPDILYLSEMMNFPGVLAGDEEVMKKIRAAQERGKPIDGHAPGLRGNDAKRYIERGMSTDHECFTLEESLEKIKYGMKIIIREGSAARNFEALYPLLQSHPEMVMLGSDDKHPDELAVSHINALCARAIAKGMELFNVLRAACINPVQHYKLGVGLLQVGDPADFILVEDLEKFQVQGTWIDGIQVAEKGKTLINRNNHITARPNRFQRSPLSLNDFAMPATGKYTLPVIGALDGQLITEQLILNPKEEAGYWVSDIERDILKIVVVNRYSEAPVAKAFIKNIGLNRGAIASSVAHDSHNIVAVGIDDESLMQAINLIVEHKGGVSVWNNETQQVLPLPVAGLMSDEDGYVVGEKYAAIDHAAKEAGSTLRSPFMTLSFMALLVIPEVKLSDLGLTICGVDGIRVVG